MRELRLSAAEIMGCGEERPLYVADLMLAKLLDIPRSILITRYDEAASPRQCAELIALASRRADGEPLSYILGEAEFYGRTFLVGPGALIPRPETELLAEEMIKRIAPGAVLADWCTGSGCIGATLLLETPAAVCFGVDSSRGALDWARRNSGKYSLEERFTLLCNSEPEDAGFAAAFFDLVVANPPYIPSALIPGLMRDVRDFEPVLALDGGEKGMDIYIKLFAFLPRILKSGGYFGCETGGDGQAAELLRIAPGCLRLELKKYDYNGILRHLIWQKEG